MKLSPFETYQLYTALKSHFTSSSYDYFKYKGKTRVTEKQFLARNDKYTYSRLSKLVPKEEMIEYMIAQFLAGKKWGGEFLDVEAKEHYREYQKRKQNFEYMFRQEVDHLFGSVENPRELFEMAENYPPILMAALQGTLCIQYFSILMKYFDFGPKFDSMLQEDYLWPDYKRKAEKLFPFLVFDDLVVRKIIKANLNL